MNGAVFLHLSICGAKTEGRKGRLLSPLGLWPDPFGFVTKTDGCKEHGLPSPLGLWPNPGERTAARLRLCLRTSAKMRSQKNTAKSGQDLLKVYGRIETCVCFSDFLFHPLSDFFFPVF